MTEYIFQGTIIAQKYDNIKNECSLWLYNNGVQYKNIYASAFLPNISQIIDTKPWDWISIRCIEAKLPMQRFLIKDVDLYFACDDNFIIERIEDETWYEACIRLATELDLSTGNVLRLQEQMDTVFNQQARIHGFHSKEAAFASCFWLNIPNLLKIDRRRAILRCF